MKLKQIISLLITFVMLLGSIPFAAIPAAAAEKTTYTELTDFNAEIGQAIEGGYELGYKAGNNCAMSSLRGKFFTWETKITIVSGDRAALLFGASTNKQSELKTGFNNFFGLEFKKYQDAIWIKMWQDGGPDSRRSGAFFDYTQVVETTKNTFDVKLAYSLANGLEIWVDGVKAEPSYTQSFDYTYGGGYFGFLAYYGNIQYTDLKLQLADEIRITCAGDSITAGTGVADAAADSYPSKLQAILGEGYAVKNAGIGGRTARPDLGGTSYIHHNRFGDGLGHDPDMVILMLGTNDANYSKGWDVADPMATLAVFKQGYQALVDAYQECGSAVTLALPAFAKVPEQQKTIVEYIIPAILEIAEAEKLPVIDMNSFTEGHTDDWYADMLHPNAVGYQAFAEKFAKHIKQYASVKALSTFKTNIAEWNTASGIWSFTDNGIYGAGASVANNAFSSLSKVPAGTAFTYEADMGLGNRSGALLFGYSDPANPTANALAVNIDRTISKCMSVFHLGTGNNRNQFKVSLTAAQLAQTGYHLKVEYDGATTLKFYLDGTLMLEKNVGDISKVWTTIPTGYVGVMAHQGNTTFNNVYLNFDYLKPSDVQMNDFEILTDGVTITPVFDPTVSIYGMDIPSGIDTITLRPIKGDNVSKIYYTLKSREYASITKQKTEVTDTIVLNKEDFIDNYVNMDLTLVSAGGKEREISFRINKWLSAEELALDKYRAQFHITPQVNFSNDPNGMVYDPTDGYWHVHYQYSPQNNTAGQQSWAHVRSKDLVNWEQMPLALQVDDLGRMYSGSAISLTEEEAKNPAIYDGIFADNKEGESRLIIFYTNASVDGKQRQCTAYSKDHGVTWTKYNGGAPIIDNDESTAGAKFGDPKVFKIPGDDNRWYMVTIGYVEMWASEDLIHWTKVQDLYYANGETYEETPEGKIRSECPGMNPVTLEGTDDQKWIYSGCDGFYVVGDMVWNEETGYYNWIAESTRIENENNFATLGLTSGPKNFGKYAGMTFYEDGTGKGRTIGMSWIKDAATPATIEGKLSSGLLTLPYEWKLKKNRAGEYVIINEPIEEIDQLHGEVLFSAENKTVAETDKNILASTSAYLFDLQAVIDVGDAEEVGFIVRKGATQDISLSYNVSSEKMTLDVSKVAGHRFHGIWPQTVELNNGKVEMRLIVDQAAVEAFGNNGESAISVSAVLENENIGMQFYVEGGSATIDSLKIYDMKSMYSGKTYAEQNGDTYTLTVPSGARMDEEIQVQYSAYPYKDLSEFTLEHDASLVEIKNEYGQVTLKPTKIGKYTLNLLSPNGDVVATKDIVIGNFETNIPQWSEYTDLWKLTENGLRCETSTLSNFAFASMSKVPAGTAFTYEADMALNTRSGALLFGFSDPANPTADALAVNIDRLSAQKCLSVFHMGTGHNKKQFKVSLTAEQLAQGTYHLKVEYDGATTLKFYLDGTLMLEKNVGDISNIWTTVPSGYVGVMAHQGAPTFNNVYLYTNATDALISTFEDITVEEKSSLDELIFRLPQSAIITQNNGFERVEKITWNTDDLSTDAPDEIILNGTVAHSDLIASIKIIVVGDDQAMIGDVTYATLEQALAAVKEKDTIKLLTNVKANRIIVDPEVTLDLNGNVLTADYVVGFATSAVIDSSDDNSGKLIIAKNRVVLDQTNAGFLPVYENDGYIFTTVKLENRAKFTDRTTFVFSPVFETFTHEALVAGKKNSGVKIVIRLEWADAGNYEATQNFAYLDERVERVIGSYDAAVGNYARAFSAAFAGSEAGEAENVKVSAVVLSETGVEIASSAFTFEG